jgi:hypothetical protein
MNLRTSPFKILCFAIIVAIATRTCTGQANPGPAASSDQPFAPFERWKSLVLAGDSAGLKLLYGTNPVAHVVTASGVVDSDAAVHYWIGLKYAA